MRIDQIKAHRAVRATLYMASRTKHPATREYWLCRAAHYMVYGVTDADFNLWKTF